MMNHNVIGKNVRLLKKVAGIPPGDYYVDYAINYDLFLQIITNDDNLKKMRFQLPTRDIKLIDYLELI